MSDLSRLCQEAEVVLQCLHDPQSCSRATHNLDWMLENGSAFQLEEVGSIASMLLKMALEEPDDVAREELFSLVETAERCNPIRAYLDYEALAGRITSLPSWDGLDYAIEILGTSRQLAYIPVLEVFLKHERLSIRLEALGAITQIWWEVSEKDPEVEQLAKFDAARHLWFLIGNPRMHTVSEAEMEQLFKTYRDDVMQNLRIWLATNR